MQVNAPFPPINRAHANMSPSSTAGSEWSGMHSYNNNAGGTQQNGPFSIPQRGDSMSPPVSNGAPNQRPFRGPSYDQYSPTDPMGPPPPPGARSNSRASSRAGSIAHSRSSDGTIADQSSRKYQRMEAELRQHYTILRTYLKGGSAQPPRPNKARDKLLRLSPVQFHELSTDVFDELQRRQAAAPLPGRPPRDKVPPFLQPRREFHEKRNQARQKLSSLQTARFRDLSTDVFCELERRFPSFNPEGRRDSTRSQGRPPAAGQNGFAPPPRTHSSNGSTSLGPNSFAKRQDSMPGEIGTGSNDYGRPMQKQFQSNTITPNKGTMVDDDEDDYDQGHLNTYSRSSDAFGLESALASPRSGRDTSGTSMTGGSREMKTDLTNPENNHKLMDLEAKIQAKDEELKELAAKTSLNVEMEQQLDELEKLNKSLQEELDRIQADHANTERDLRSQLTAARESAGGGDWKVRHEQLDREHRDLRNKYDHQLRTTEEVSKQFKVQLTEMRALAESTTDSVEREEKLHHEVQRLSEELKEWKSRYAKAKTQLRTTRTSTIGLSIPQPGLGNLAGANFKSEDGIVKDVNITRFQIAVDELLKVARSEEADTILESMKSLVNIVRAVTGDVDSCSDDSKDEEVAKKRNKLKTKVSATANNVITATKNYIAAAGLSPVSLLDAAVSHLTAAVVELIRLVKIRPTPMNELDEHEESHLTPVNTAGYFDAGHSNRRKSITDSIYSALSDPAEGEQTPHGKELPQTNGYSTSNGLGISQNGGLKEDEAELEELKVYLGNQTDILVQSVQGLVTSVRSDEGLPAIRNHVSNIVDVVENVLGASEGAMDDPSSFQEALVHHIESSVNAVRISRDKLERAGLETQRHEGQASAKQFVQSLPPMAFQLAREVRELVSQAESVEVGYSGDDDFS